ncbi:NAD(P)H-binding protein [Streptomyces sp. NPDC090083]|uniref:NAD(P)-dependent oxidoreductase n=1 Tax=Streptomyces sp. NPDC090083 TaxID=3365941 RepID=UPI00381E5EE3
MIEAGVHLVRKAGGEVTDVQGDPWRPGSRDIPASALSRPHAGGPKVLSTLRWRSLVHDIPAGRTVTAGHHQPQRIIMKLTILGATGATGRELTQQALDRGHDVTAIARQPERIDASGSGSLTRVQADVLDPESIDQALKGAGLILSGLGIAAKEAPGVLTAGARAAVESGADNVIWLAAFGTGDSAPYAGALTRKLLGTFMKKEMTDRVTADTTVLRSGGTVFHAGPMSEGPLSPTMRTVPLDQAPRRVFPARISRATIAAAMLDEAENPRYPGRIAIPLER